MRPTRDDVGLLAALMMSIRGTCARRKVGCFLFDADFRVLATGFNGPPSKAPHCIDTPCEGAFRASGTGLDICEALHAETNALLACTEVRNIHTCYTTTSPCVSCVKSLLGTGCKRIVFAELYPHKEAEIWWTRAGREWLHYLPPGYATCKTVVVPT